MTNECHIPFEKECETIDLVNFRKNRWMTHTVQNCSKESGERQLQYILEHHKHIIENVNYNLLHKLDSVGGYNDFELVNGLTPKVFDYIRDAILFVEYYLKPKNITEINKLLIIGAGYGLEAAILHHICDICHIKIRNIIGIDTPNVAKLQNEYFKVVDMDTICKSYSTYEEKVDIVYSKCCLSELQCHVNYMYYKKYCLPSKGFYLVWGLWAADLPIYYIPYRVYGEHNTRINDWLENNTNTVLVK